MINLVNLKKLEDDILEYLNDVPVVDRFHYQICLNSNVKDKFTYGQLVEFNNFCFIETSHHLHITSYLEYDIVCVNTHYCKPKIEECNI